MRRASNTGLNSDRIRLRELVENRKYLAETSTRASAVQSEYLALLEDTRSGKFNKVFAAAVNRLRPKNGEYMLAPLNLLLWLYELGNVNDRRASILLYTTLGAKVREIRKLPHKANYIRLQDIPITKRGREILADYAVELSKPQNRTFNTLQMLITALALSAHGCSGTAENVLVHQAFWYSAPLVPMGLVAAPKEYNPGYVLSYNQLNPTSNCGLFAIVQAMPLCLLLNCLIERMGPIGPRDTTVLSRPALAAKLLTYMSASRSTQKREVLSSSVMFSNSYIWIAEKLID